MLELKDLGEDVELEAVLDAYPGQPGPSFVVTEDGDLVGRIEGEPRDMVCVHGSETSFPAECWRLAASCGLGIAAAVEECRRSDPAAWRRWRLSLTPKQSRTGRNRGWSPATATPGRVFAWPELRR